MMPAVASSRGLVSRYFINQTATRILELSQKELFQFIGNYDYYLEKKETIHAASKSYQTTFEKSADAPSENKLNWQQQKEHQAQIRKIENEIKKLEDEIAALEERNEEIDSLLEKEEVYTNLQELQKYSNEKKEIENQIEKCMERWEICSQQLP